MDKNENNLDELLRPSKTIIIAGKKLKVSKVPLIVSIKANQIGKKYQEKNINDDKALEILNEMVELVLIVCRASGNEIKKEWVLENADIYDLRQFIAIASSYGAGIDGNENDTKKKEIEEKK
ncbi:MAG TPA: hypothetical protein VMW32_00835 [Bacteroidales bacterium]|nr:hypothetical protein [Bacteroidales bacterium]